MPRRLDDECPRPVEMDSGVLTGFAPGIFPASVYRCDDPAHAEALLGGERDGFAYQRDKHPNAEMLAEKCTRLHQAEWSLIAGSGMAAIAVAALTRLQRGEHIVISNQLYGRSTQLLADRLSRLGIDVSTTDMQNLDAVRRAIRGNTRLLVVETLANPMLRVAPLDRLAELAHQAGAELLVDNTFATPAVCQPLQWEADFVVESLSKLMNGHSDVMLGLLCGRTGQLDAFRETLSIWGMNSSPFDAWLALRGLTTFHLRVARTSESARFVAERLSEHPAVQHVRYPTLATHPDAKIVSRLFTERLGGSMVTFQLRGGRAAAERFIRSAREIPFCPSLGEVSTTLSHPASTSHRGLTVEQRAELGIDDGTIRLSIGTESPEWTWRSVAQGLA